MAADHTIRPMLKVSLIAAGVVALLMLGTWAESLRRRDVSIVDAVWGPAFVLVAAVGVIAGSDGADVRFLLAALTTVWGLRLGWHLVRRKLAEPEEDRRYAAMREHKGERFARWSLVMIFGVQGLLVLIVSLPIQAAAGRVAGVTFASVPGVLLVAVGLAFEAIGDAQLAAFKRDPGSRGQVMDRGLWRYTRHPNYFGDFCVWWGLWLVALSAGGTWWTAIGPVVMSVLLIRVSGKGLLEKTIAKRRPGYEEYVRRTSGFVPLPPRD
jgi:steroid 5-alpha reductase family enzyme